VRTVRPVKPGGRAADAVPGRRAPTRAKPTPTTTSHAIRDRIFLPTRVPPLSQPGMYRNAGRIASGCVRAAQRIRRLASSPRTVGLAPPPTQPDAGGAL